MVNVFLDTHGCMPAVRVSTQDVRMPVCVCGLSTRAHVYQIFVCVSLCEFDHTSHATFSIVSFTGPGNVSLEGTYPERSAETCIYNSKDGPDLGRG